MWHGPKPTSIPSGTLIHPVVWPQQTWAENWGLCPILGELDTHLAQLHNVAWAEAYLHTKWHLDPSSRLATIDMGRKFGGSVPIFRRGAGSPSNTMSLGPRHTSLPSGVLIHPAIWPQHMGRKLGAVPLWGRGAGSPSNTMWPWPRPTCMPSFVLMHPTV